jgi:hypothetical protein
MVLGVLRGEYLIYIIFLRGSQCPSRFKLQDKSFYAIFEPHDIEVQ